jgi:tRNA-modifying protein YgfZ
MPIAYLAERGVVRVAGEEAKGFLDGLLTCDLDRVGPGRPRYGGLLTPQGKILFDFIVFQADGGEAAYYLDCRKAQAADLARRLGFYKLRAKVAIADLSDTLGVLAGWGNAPKPAADVELVSDDPRLPALGWRAIASPPEGEAEVPSSIKGEGEAAYHAHRIALGVPEGGEDFAFGDAFPHEALMDQLHGVDFDKGCYVGQEVVSRMQHRGTARTRIVPLVYPDGSAAAPGADVTAGERAIGKTGTGAGHRGLAMIRLDRAADALAAGETIRAGGRPVRLETPDWATYRVEAATPAA